MWLGPNDARCCPSIEKTTRYRLQGNKVVEVASQPAAERPGPAANMAAAKPLPPLGLVPGYYANTGYCRGRFDYFFYDGKRVGLFMEHSSDLVPMAKFKRNGKWWSIPDAGWAMQVQGSTRILLAIQDEVPASLCPLNEVSAWVRRQIGL